MMPLQIIKAPGQDKSSWDETAINQDATVVEVGRMPLVSKNDAATQEAQKCVLCSVLLASTGTTGPQQCIGGL
jgi:hypothetical protein